jgi:hypothetical protein
MPIKYSVEEYGVVFVPASGNVPNYTGKASGPGPETVRLQVRTFKVDTNTFSRGLENAFGISMAPSKQALRRLLEQLGIDMQVPPKAVFYNDLTGIVMVRATAEDLELVQAAIETLGGSLLNQAMASVGSEQSSSEPNNPADLMKQRYGARPMRSESTPPGQRPR